MGYGSFNGMRRMMERLPVIVDRVLLLEGTICRYIDSSSWLSSVVLCMVVVNVK